jgi:hypothetical protein
MSNEKIRFSDSLSIKWNWPETAFQINTGKAFQHKQELVALFLNAYTYIELKFEPFLERHGKVPIEDLNKLVSEFRQSFPKYGRVEGVNYFDDLIHQLIAKHNKHKKGGENSKRKPDLAKIENAKKIFKAGNFKAHVSIRKLHVHLTTHGVECGQTWVRDHYQKITS